VANHKSAKKRAKQNIVKHNQNKTQLSRSRTLVKKFRETLAAKNTDAAGTLFVEVQSLLAKLGRQGVTKTKTASRKISRLANQLNALVK
jgi:small subunit ribosomal protein S20